MTFEVPELAEVRSAIDQIDRQLVELLVQRQHLVSRAATLKRTDAEVQAPARAEAVVNRAQAFAEKQGGSSELIGRIFTEMVAAYINYEHGTRRRPEHS